MKLIVVFGFCLMTFSQLNLVQADRSRRKSRIDEEINTRATFNRQQRLNTRTSSVNLALNKPSFQSSIYSYKGHPHSAKHANDGNRNTNVQYCAISHKDGGSWWAVDLVRATYVGRIVFTSASGGWGFRSNNLIVGLTNESPKTKPPVLGQYAICGHGPSKMADGATISIECSYGMPPFRYVIVQFPPVEAITICEVEVYPRCPSDFEYVSSVSGCYKMVTEPLGWTLAGLRCSSFHKNANLLKIETAKEQKAIAEWLASDKGSSRTHCVWAAGHRIDSTDPEETAWFWKVLSAENYPLARITEMTYTNWNTPGKQPTSDAKQACLCVKVDIGHPFPWHDALCRRKFSSICEIDVS